ncbi:MAG: trypsin-like peptidase domain-containing protein [Burkholderiaceae bacterium]
MNAVWRFLERIRRRVERRRLRCWIAAACIACNGTAAAQDIDRIRALVLAGSVLKVEAVNGNGRVSLGTAVSVAPGTFVTNCHVTRNASVVVLVHDGARWPVASERADLYFDLCLLRAPGLADIAPIPLATARALRINQPVAAAGYSGGMGIQLRPGIVSGLHELGGSKVIQTTTAFTSGASGGALLNADGELAGILTFRLRGAEGYYFASPVDWIAGHVDDTSGFAPVTPLQGAMPFWAQPGPALPPFMQAASMEHDGRWDDLIALTNRWTEASPRDAESPFMRGNGYIHQGELSRAIVAFRDAVALDPRYVRAWLDLGKAYVRTGALVDAGRIVTVLRGLDPASADDLEDAMSGRTHEP